MDGISVTAVDVNPSAIAKAKQARYSSWAMRATPQQIRERYFRQEGKAFRLVDDVRTKVEFYERNLLEDEPVLWAMHSFDVIFCRNVVIYFSAESTRKVVQHFAQALVPGGVLFMGHSETLENVSTDFERHYWHGAFCYVRKDSTNDFTQNTDDPTFESFAPVMQPTAISWVKEIGDAADRVERLIRANDISPPSEQGRDGLATKHAPPSAGESFDKALRLFHDERLQDALAALRSATPEANAPWSTQLLLAMILCHCGDVVGAKRVCLDILGADPKSGEAHHVLSLCCKHEGNAVEAAEHAYNAILAEPNFAIAHLHLGILLRRAGQWGAASSSLSKALALLPHETEQRIHLFGEGFRREALMVLCRAEIHNLGRNV